MNQRRCQTDDDASVRDFSETRPDNTRIRTYVWGSDLSGSMQGAGGVGGLLEVSCYGSATTNCFPAFDGNGNVTALINAADGTVAANYEYAAFGEPVRVTGAMARNNPFRFSTKYADDESDLLYYGYRYYKPSTGTWLSRDPKTSLNDANVYGFVRNAPIIKLDALGLFTQPIIQYVPDKDGNFGSLQGGAFWLSLEFNLDPDSAMESRTEFKANTHKCYCPADGKSGDINIDKTLYSFTTANNTFSFGGDETGSEQKNMIGLANSDADFSSSEGTITMTLDFAVVSASPMPDGFSAPISSKDPSNAQKSHAPWDNSPPSGWDSLAPKTTYTITCTLKCGGMCECQSSPEIAAGLPRLGRSGPRNNH